jgi:hypothetical protein
LNVTGLTPAQRYYFVVRTVTSAHANNANIVESDPSSEVSAVAWTEIAVQITGTVTSGGSPLAGVVMNGLTGSPSTNASGVYTGTVSAGWSGTVIPVFAGYSFNPASRNYTSVSTDQTAQNYSATAVVPTLTVTSPNGGETWAVGSTHAVTWTQTNLTGSVTIDLYKGGVFNKTLGTVAASTETFSWAIGTSETVGMDYMVRVWQDGGVSDDSDADFSITRLIKVDFNRDGQEDLLWRYQGTGEYQGWGVVWLMNQTQGLSAMPLQSTAPGSITPAKGSSPSMIYNTPLDAGDGKETASIKATRSPMGITDPAVGTPKSVLKTPMEPDRGRALRTKDEHPARVPTMRDAETLSAPGSGTMELAALGISDYIYLNTISDLSWEIAGTGDFNGDGDTDILWRNYGSGELSGWNVIWYMNNGWTTGFGYLNGISDLDWRIAGTGDFNRDGRMDILWRNYGSGEFSGWNVIWYMDGEGIASFGYLYGISDLDWQIVGTGDFNRDGHMDILWRNYGSGEFSGWNVIWYMDGEGIAGFGYLYGISDLSWQIAGTGDFDNDGDMDILWRYYGSGEYQGWNCIWYMEGEGITGFDYPNTILDTSWRIVNR